MVIGLSRFQLLHDQFWIHIHVLLISKLHYIFSQQIIWATQTKLQVIPDLHMTATAFLLPTDVFSFLLFMLAKTYSNWTDMCCQSYGTSNICFI